MPAVGDRVILARDLHEALDALSNQPELLPLCGGTDAYGDSGPAGTPPWGFVSLRRVSELHGISRDADRVRIGAAVTAAELLADPLIASELPIIAQAARALGTRQIRSRASVGGNVCTARADHTLVPVLLALDAEVETAGPGGTARVPLAEHLARWAAGSTQRTELVTAITARPVDGYQQFARVGARNGPCYATASAALVVDPQQRSAHLALGNAAPTTIRATAAEDYAAAGRGLGLPHRDPRRLRGVRSAGRPGQLAGHRSGGLGAVPQPRRRGDRQAPAGERRSRRAGRTGGGPMTDSERISYDLQVNGAAHHIEDAWYFESLLNVLRDRLGMTGTKYSCDTGQCGACTVTIDGAPVNSCIELAAAATESDIRTIEDHAAGSPEPTELEAALLRRWGHPVRVLHARHHHVGQRLPRREPGPQPAGDQGGP